MPARITDARAGRGSPPARRSSTSNRWPPLVVSPYPELREPADPAAPPVRAVAPSCSTAGSTRRATDDRFVLATTPGQRLRIKVEASELGSALDGVLQVLGKSGSVIANADDTTIPLPRDERPAGPVARLARSVARVDRSGRHQRDHRW